MESKAGTILTMAGICAAGVVLFGDKINISGTSYRKRRAAAKARRAKRRKYLARKRARR